jgi:type IV secretory pathway protease TraF
VWTALAAVGIGLGWATRLGTRWPTIYYMTDPSMEPTVRMGEYFLAWSPPGGIKRGDLVIFRYEDEDGVFAVPRRVAGLPGDTVAELGRRVVPADSVALLSDRGDMLGWPDSRFLGFIPRRDIEGRATRTLTGRRLRD